MKRFVYADNAATTPVSPVVLGKMTEVLTDVYGNPSSIYSKGREAAVLLAEARAKIAGAIGATEREIFFTSGGSEADNWAIKGAAEVMAKKGKKHIITTAFEHHAVLHCTQKLEKNGFDVTYLPVNSDGVVKLDDFTAALREDTGLVTIMMANNEIGTVQPISEIGKICREKGILLHTDAVQAMGHIPINVADLSVDMLSVSGHKLHAAKGVGFLYIRRGVRIANLMDGGAQESMRRAGTENTASIAGMAAAVEDAVAHMDERHSKILAMRERLIDEVLKIERSRLNGSRTERLPGNANFCFEGIEGESLLLMLDNLGVCASSGSACTSGSLDPSHVLLAIGLPHEIAHGSLRISLDYTNTEENVDYILEILPTIVRKLRDMSPLWDRIIGSQK
ncbi:MAG: cysteine desulfurase NifS [Oscillospiraceae bacterium]|jgi:cysteine desulfurase|nr:cysteine desulfurase NifS [Oscillospiraceae bacterium]